MKKLLITAIAFIIIGVTFMFGKTVSAKNITVSPDVSDASADGSYYSRDYINIRNALNQISNAGGGTLTLKSGTYKVSNTLYVGSNTNIKFEKNVTIDKLFGSASSSTLFQLIDFGHKDSSNVYGGYNGKSNIHFYGDESTIIDMHNKNIGKTPAIAVVMANNSDVSFYGITFQNIKLGHIIEMDGCKNVKISYCTFKNMADNKYHNKEAINLDTNDLNTGGFSQSWSKKDKTPNKNISIYDCQFENLVRAVGTHRYSLNKYHTNILFRNNKVTKVKTPLGMLNWKNATIRRNQFNNCKANKKYNYSFFMAGVRNIKFYYNSFNNVKSKEVLKYYPKYQTSQKEYKPTKSKLSKKNIKLLKQNYARKGTKRKFKIGKKKYKWIKD